jgi:[acyl-carrier-protein] S-malonyltransferase
MPLSVAGAFHSSFMAPAQEDLSAALAGADLGEPDFPVWSNTTAKPHDPDSIGETLIRQVIEPVLFSDSLVDMAGKGIRTFVHVGPGDVTAGLARRTVDGAEVLVVSDLEGAGSAQEALVSIERP